MNNRAQRLEAIKKIISDEVISSQDDLQARLYQMGVDVTQATLSRDLKSLRVVKVSDEESGYSYQLPSRVLLSSIAEAETGRLNYLADGVIGIEFSGNLSVLKTLPGYASSIALAIDEGSCHEIIGTIAGDDTILLVLRDGVGRSEVVKALTGIMPRLENVI